MNIFSVKYHKLLLLVFLSMILTPIAAQRQIKTLNDGWRFIREDVNNAYDISFDDSNWQKVSVPHTWNEDAYIEKDYYRGFAWYRKNFDLPENEKDNQIFLRFEGINHSAWVYINGRQVGEHKGGYTSFTFDITAYCRFGENNHIAIKVDNSLSNVPTISGDFTIFGGMYRDVWLISTSKQHIDLENKGSDGIFIDTQNVSGNSATYTVKGTVVNEALSKTELKVINKVWSPDKKLIKTTEQKIRLNAGAKYDFLQTATIENPLLWSPESPNLYTVETIIKESRTGQILDALNSTLGFRWFSFDGEKGFSLNGKPYKLNGICRHQDQMPYGNALSDEAHRRDMQLIKDMGANFIRISHYPQDKAIIEQCDKLGLLVWEEIPVIDIVPDSPEFMDISESMLREMIRQHYNHPSVIMWGYMNEILLVTQRKYKGKELEEATQRAVDLAKRLEKVLKEEDNNRYSVMAFHGSDSYNKAGFAEIVDIIGWNLYQGWYSDNMSQFDKFMERQQRDYPDKPKIVSEYGAGSDKRIHSLHPKRFDFSIEYQQQYAEHYLAVIEREPYIMGATYWNFIDFGSAQRDESMPRINNKGLVYADRTPKDVYYLFKANFRKDIPVLHIASNDWKNRTGVSVERNPVMQPVKVYSNLPEVELFMNGQSLGTKKCENYKAVWDIPFTIGTHYFSAKGKKGDDVIETGMEISFISVPDKFDRDNIEGVELAINSGSDVFYTSPQSNQTWVPDKEYSVGGWGYIGGEKQNTQTQIQGTIDNPLFQTLRVAPQSYRFDVPQGEYEIELLFADIFVSSETIAHALGSDPANNISDNIFDILINDTKVDIIDMKNSSGYFRGIKKRYIVKIEQDENITVKFNARSGKTFINGLKIRKL